ncbi:hypothetical protein LCGC14_2732560, partial [marine sediment metagenome]
DKLVDELVGEGLVGSYGDLYRLELEPLEGLERMGRKSSENLLAGVEASKDRGLARLLGALTIRHVGARVAAVLAEIVEALRPGGTTTQVLAASIRHPEHVVTAAQLGCEVATVPAKVFRQMLEHPLTEKGRERFKADWESRPEFVEWLKALVSRQPTSA